MGWDERAIERSRNTLGADRNALWPLPFLPPARSDHPALCPPTYALAHTHTQRIGIVFAGLRFSLGSVSHTKHRVLMPPLVSQTTSIIPLSPVQSAAASLPLVAVDRGPGPVPRLNSARQRLQQGGPTIHGPRCTQRPLACAEPIFRNTSSPLTGCETPLPARREPCCKENPCKKNIGRITARNTTALCTSVILFTQALVHDSPVRVRRDSPCIPRSQSIQHGPPEDARCLLNPVHHVFAERVPKLRAAALFYRASFVLLAAQLASVFYVHHFRPLHRGVTAREVTGVRYQSLISDARFQRRALRVRKWAKMWAKAT